MDLMTLYEVFGRKDYGEDFAGQTVIDVGAYNGDSAVFFALHGAKRVIALEPYPPNFALAQANIQRMGLEERVTLLPLALGVQDGKAIFQVAPTEPDANALEPPKSPLQKLVRYESQVEVEVCSLPTLRVREGLEEIDFLKLDCEGCEFALLSSLSIEEMRRVRVWHIEYHARPQPLIEKLTAAGYKVEKQRDRGVLGYLVARRGKVQ
jgi:FkbM family methyltransferase